MIHCETFLEQLQDYLDEFLSEQSRTEMETHLGECSSCREELTAFQTIMRETSQLPASIEPERDLWDGIIAMIESDTPSNVVSFSSRSRRIVRGSFAAAAGFVFVAGIAFFTLTVPYVEEGEKPPVADAFEEEYKNAKAVLLNALEERREQLPEDILATVEENLGIIEDAMVDINRALAEHPDDPKLKQMLQSARQTDLDVLQTAIKMENDS